MTTSHWWDFFPLQGFTITDTASDLSLPMFRDTILVSRQHVPDMVATFRGDFDAGEMQARLAEQLFGKSDDSWIAVRRRGTYEIDSAWERARTVAALISLAVLTESPDWKTCRLSRNRREERQEVFLVPIDTPGEIIGEEVRGDVSFTRDSPLNRRRDELAALLGSPALAPLTRVLTHRSAMGTVREAAVLLADVIHGSDETQVLLGAFTALEILLADADSDRRFDTLKQRVKVLIGRETFEAYEGEYVFRSRRSPLHEGWGVTGEMARLGTGLALSVLLRFTALAQELRSKGQVLAYLEYQGARERFLRGMEEQRRQEYPEGKRLSEPGQVFPYFNEE